MNFSDSEVVASILIGEGYTTTLDELEADIILINTCSIRDNAELRVRKRLTNFKNRKKKTTFTNSWCFRMYGRATEKKNYWRRKSSLTLSRVQILIVNYQT